MAIVHDKAPVDEAPKEPCHGEDVDVDVGVGVGAGSTGGRALSKALGENP